MRIAYFCFIVAVLAALTGMGLGIFMAVRQDFSLAPAHAHINLLGWVTLALLGLYHRGVARSGNRRAWTQVGCAAAGFLLMTGGLASYLATQNTAFVPLVMAGALICVASMALFLAVLISDARRGAARLPEGAAAPA